MTTDRGASILANVDQWSRCRHTGTAVWSDPTTNDLPAIAGVQLTWEDDEHAPLTAPASAPAPSGLAFDQWRHAYLSRPSDGDVVASSGAADVIVWQAPAGEPGDPPTPLGLAVDADARLYVADPAGAQIVVIDLYTRTVRSRYGVSGPESPGRRPLDLAARGSRVVALLLGPDGLGELRCRTGLRPGAGLRPPECAEGVEPRRIALTPDGQVLILWRHPADRRALVCAVDGSTVADVPGATDLDVSPDGVLIVARDPMRPAGEGNAAAIPARPFRRFTALEGGGWQEIEPLSADRYDGGAVSVAPDGGVGYTTERGMAWTAGSAARYVAEGHVVSYRLDSGSYRTRWGRVFLDACLPSGTDLRLQCLTSDVDVVVGPLTEAPPARGGRVTHPEQKSPDLPPAAGWHDDPLAAAWLPLHHRTTGREWPWAQVPSGDRYETYEAPVSQPAGRYLWVGLRLTGSTLATPRVRGLRVERPGHHLLDYLPRAWSRDEGDAEFLYRFLAPAEGLLHELDERAAQRVLLLDPETTPAETLGWLASFAGLVLDERWPDAARRRIVAEAYPLFRRRGTLGMLRRMLEIYLGYAPAVIEQWRLRGPGGMALGRGAVGGPRVGQDLRLGGIGTSVDDYQAAAHRFAVVVPASLTAEQRDVVGQILDEHRPAHTLGEICEAGDGMRVGRRLHVQVTSVIGRESRGVPLVVGNRLGVDGIVGGSWATTAEVGKAAS